MHRLDTNGLTEKEFLAQYNPGGFPRPSVTVDIVVFTVVDVKGDNYRKLSEKELCILLIRRAVHPFLGQWALPGGFVRPNETVGEAAKRELAEETGIQVGYLEQLYTFSKPERDPRTWVISCAHIALINSNRLVLKAGSDTDDARWFTVNVKNQAEFFELSLVNSSIHLQAVMRPEFDGPCLKTVENHGLAFDHAEIIAYAIRRLRAKLEHTDLVFSLMPEKFTLTELQQIYESILNKPLFKAAFRRKFKNLVIETDEYTQKAGHRPSKIYTRRKEFHEQ